MTVVEPSMGAHIQSPGIFQKKNTFIQLCTLSFQLMGTIGNQKVWFEL